MDTSQKIKIIRDKLDILSVHLIDDLSKPKNFKKVYDLFLNCLTLGEELKNEMSYSDEKTIIFESFSIISLIKAHEIAINSTIIDLDETVINKLLTDKTLTDYVFVLKRILKTKEHAFDYNSPFVIDDLNPIIKTTNDIFDSIKDDGIKYQTITKYGDQFLVNSDFYQECTTVNDHIFRKQIYDIYNKTINDYDKILCNILFKHIENQYTLCNLHDYENPFQNALSFHNFDDDLYENIFRNVNNNINNFQDYLAIKQDVLKYKKLNYCDVDGYISDKHELTTGIYFENDDEFNAGLSTLLSDVYKNLDIEYNSFLTDKIKKCNFENEILFYNGKKCQEINNLFDLLVNDIYIEYNKKYQPLANQNDNLLIENIIKTTNNLLILNNHLINTSSDDDKKTILNNIIMLFNNNVIKNSLFCEFKLKLYDDFYNHSDYSDDCEYEEIDSSDVKNIYFELLNKYYNDVKIDELYANECLLDEKLYKDNYHSIIIWVSAIFFTSKIIDNDKEYIDKYLNLLKSGSSDFTNDLLKNAGIDFSTDEPFEVAFEFYSDFIDKLNELY